MHPKCTEPEATEFVNKVANFLKVFNTPSKQPLVTYIDVWNEVSVTASPTVNMAKVLAKKSIDHALASGSEVEATMPLLDISDSEAGRYGCKLVKDSGLRDSTALQLAEGVFDHIFTFNVDKKDAESILKGQDRAMQQVEKMMLQSSVVLGA